MLQVACVLSSRQLRFKGAATFLLAATLALQRCLYLGGLCANEMCQRSPLVHADKLLHDRLVHFARTRNLAMQLKKGHF